MTPPAPLHRARVLAHHVDRYDVAAVEDIDYLESST